jgi:hypothetical protein
MAYVPSDTPWTFAWVGERERSRPTAGGGHAPAFFPHCAGRAAPQAPRGRQPYFSTKYAPLPCPLENQRLVTVFLRV